MNDRDFTYWLQGFVELHGAPPTAQQWEVIKEHLSLVFTKVTTKVTTKTVGGIPAPIRKPQFKPFEPPFGSMGDSILPGATYCAPLGGNLLCKAEPDVLFKTLDLVSDPICGAGVTDC